MLTELIFIHYLFKRGHFSCSPGKIKNIEVYQGHLTELRRHSVHQAEKARHLPRKHGSSKDPRPQFLTTNPRILLWWLRGNPGCRSGREILPGWKATPRSVASLLLAPTRALKRTSGECERGTRQDTWREHGARSGRLILLKWVQARNVLPFKFFQL